MLCLFRKLKESVVLDAGRITVTVLGLDRGRVRLGFTCDRSIRVDREEVHRAKLAEAGRIPDPNPAAA